MNSRVEYFTYSWQICILHRQKQTRSLNCIDSSEVDRVSVRSYSVFVPRKHLQNLVEMLHSFLPVIHPNQTGSGDLCTVGCGNCLTAKGPCDPERLRPCADASDGDASAPGPC